MVNKAFPVPTDGSAGRGVIGRKGNQYPENMSAQVKREHYCAGDKRDPVHLT